MSTRLRNMTFVKWRILSSLENIALYNIIMKNNTHLFQ